MGIFGSDSKADRASHSSPDAHATLLLPPLSCSSTLRLCVYRTLDITQSLAATGSASAPSRRSGGFHAGRCGDLKEREARDRLRRRRRCSQPVDLGGTASLED